MESIFNFILPIHIFAGVSSLILFWIPALVKKGSRVHNSVGQWYVRLMWAVVITSALLCFIRVTQGAYVIASFLGFITLITSHPLWYGVVITKYKKALPKKIIYIRKAIMSAVLLYGLGMLVSSYYFWGHYISTLMLVFGLMGINAGRMVFKPTKQLQSMHHWLIEHIDGMISTGIAAYTAFFAFGGRTVMSSLLTEQWQVLPWVLPSVLGIFVIRRLKRKLQHSSATTVGSLPTQ